MNRLLISTVMIAILATTVVGFAATLGIGADDLAAGDAVIAECDDSFSHTFTTSGGNVTHVTVDGIADPACEGGELSLTLTKDGVAIGSGGPETIPTDGDTADNSVAVAISSPPTAADVNGIHTVVVGP